MARLALFGASAPAADSASAAGLMVQQSLLLVHSVLKCIFENVFFDGGGLFSLTFCRLDGLEASGEELEEREVVYVRSEVAHPDAEVLFAGHQTVALVVQLEP